MAVPELKVEIAFSVGPYATDAEIASSEFGWVDVTDHVKEVNVHRGRGNDWDESFVSTASIVLTNDDREFDPFNVAGPYFNLLNPRRQIKVTGTVDGTEYPIFRGYVNGFPVNWTNVGKISTITIDAFDVLALVAADELKGDLAEIYTRSLSPVHYYRCSDPSGSDSLKDIGSASKNLAQSSGGAGSRAMTSSVWLGMGLSGTSANLESATYEKFDVVSPNTGDISVAMWCAFPNATGIQNLFTITQVASPYNTLQADMYVTSNPNQKVTVEASSTGGSKIVQSTSTGLQKTAPAHHYVVTYKKSTGELLLYVDGVSEGIVTSTSGTFAGFNYFPTSVVSTSGCIVQEFAIFNTVLTASQITNLYGFGQGNQTETTGERLGRLLALTDIPSEKYSVHATSAASISGVPEPNASVIDALSKAQKTEAGNLFVQSNGVLKTTERTYFVGKTSQATFTDDGTAFGYSGDIDIWYDGDNLRNDIVVKYGGNSSSLASGLFDPGSIEENGKHTLTVESQSATSTESSDLSKFWLRYGILNPPSISKFEVGMSATTEQWETLLGLELLDRITFKRTPPAGTPLIRQLLINSLDFSLTPKIWKMQIAGSARFTTVFNTRDAFGIGTSGSSTSTLITDAPEIRNVSAPAYTYDTATFSGEVNAKGTATNVRIQYSTDSSFASFTELTPTPSTVSGSSWTTVSASVSGLTANTTYYFRVKAYNSVATVYGSGGGITTYRLKVVVFTSSGTWTAPTWGGTAMTSCYYTQLVAGGGGGGGFGGGGGGGGGQFAQLNTTLSSSMVGVVGAGGGEGASGGDSSLTNVSFPCYGGGSGLSGSVFGTPDGGASGVGFGGGAGYYAFFTGVSAGGGGGGASGPGAAYTASGESVFGGNGGGAATTTYWGHSFGGGGGGASIYGNGSSGGGTYGAGQGGNFGSSTGGLIEWLYYGPSGSRSGTGWYEVNY